MCGIALGVMALIVVLSVMNGFQKEVRDRMLSVLSHVEVFDGSGSLADWRTLAAQAGKHPEVRAAAPFPAPARMGKVGSPRMKLMLERAPAIYSQYR